MDKKYNRKLMILFSTTYYPLGLSAVVVKLQMDTNKVSIFGKFKLKKLKIAARSIKMI